MRPGVIVPIGVIWIAGSIIGMVASSGLPSRSSRPITHSSTLHADSSVPL